ncbi:MULTISPECIES: 4Fe-4S dicluster domain-containing protein [Pseudothermotoga]|uniref:4Fe-4S ferredoxin iron-sulfur binding domain protein n=1 Tax=Pseudothermotoga lettingae (strain ATCC BAA-301 / DSM 14385 / NBRC 107922 / TMO) TaxID=416591 RepID=A8F831_PSELT|nr:MULTISPECIES: ferredoxin family protein [Pseudothermotoga]ABV34315.1 4Fe-4S ferredoxin iron-sulfur binding domain protein [Pseudothermotoga lettingae TMO]GLI48740.1 4Fe-4S ferredoxin [Pseudothermotoga lettingae TMO]HBJ81804.1 ferredoxin family protein [Pseudothermotoga sp.]HBT25745.1 ferredoxin family protein [Pseudothermotoga sp.]
MKKAYIEIDSERCKGCGLCINACPQKIIRFSTKFNSKGYHPAEQYDPQEKCPGCGFCYMMCPDTCITVYKLSQPVR